MKFDIKVIVCGKDDYTSFWLTKMKNEHGQKNNWIMKHRREKADIFNRTRLMELN